MKICSYIDDKKNGEYKEYYEDGQLCNIYIYSLIDGKLNGKFKICSYIDDKINGEYKKYNENGDLIEHSIYDNEII